MKHVLCPLPSMDFDPTEVSIPWRTLKDEGVQVTFATPEGKMARADEVMIHGNGLGPFRSMLVARSDAQSAYRELILSEEFARPIRYEDMDSTYDALLMPGGHAKGMREYLESSLVQRTVVEYFKQDKTVAAICHGCLAVARSIDPTTGKSVLFDRQTTGLNFLQELSAWILTLIWMGNYYRTYPKFMQFEVEDFLQSKKNFVKGPLPLFRESENNLYPGYCLVDGSYISARWPGDVYNFTKELVAAIKR